MSFERVDIGDSVTLYRGDCLDVLPTLVAGAVDAVVTDPPYGVGLTVKTNDFRDSKAFDNGRSLQASVIYQDEPDVIRELLKRAIPLCQAVTGRMVITPGHRLLFDYPQPTSMGCVFLPNGAGRDSWGFNCFSPILYYGKCPYNAKGLGGRPNSFTTCQPNREVIDHPCPKPLPWMLWLVQRASLEGDSILDPFMGSGTTGVACARLGRKFVGIEKEPAYFEIAIDRITAELNRAPLFEPPVQVTPAPTLFD